MKIRCLITLISILAISAPVSAQVADPCDGVTPVTIGPRTSDTAAAARIQTALSSFSFDQNGTARICFNIQDERIIQITSPLLLHHVGPGSDQQIVISGLRVRLDTNTTITTPLLHITSDVKVSLRNTTITGATHGIRLQGNAPHEIIGGEVACDPTATTRGIGIDIQSDGAKVKGMRIHDCGEGISIIANDALIGAESADQYEQDKNEIYRNNRGIHLLFGNRVRFAYNSVYRNPDSTAQTTPDSGILMDEPLLTQLGRPAIDFVDQQTKEALRCQKDETGTIISRQLHFDVPAAGEMIIFQTQGDDSRQGKTYLTKCLVNASGLCEFQFPSNIQVDTDKCGIQLHATALLLTNDHSTVYIPEVFLLDGISTILLPAGPGPVGTAGALDPNIETSAPLAEEDKKSDESSAADETTSSGGALQGLGSARAAGCALIQ